MRLPKRAHFLLFILLDAETLLTTGQVGYFKNFLAPACACTRCNGRTSDKS